MTIRTKKQSTWCPGCWNHKILDGAIDYFEKQIKAGKKKTDFSMASGIGCHGKIFNYLSIPGLNALHGRVIPVCLGIKIANPKKTVFGFSGDGDSYAEGISHLIHAAKNNIDINYMVHDNQVFALTVAQPTPTTEIGYKDKTTPFGVKVPAINPLKLMLASKATFVARVWADKKQISDIMDKAAKHKGFSFIEIIQPCIVFHPAAGYQKYSYQIKGHNIKDINKAMKLAEVYDYSKPASKDNKIPLGIFYQEKRPTFEDLVRERK